MPSSSRGCSGVPYRWRVLKSATHPLKPQLFSRRRKACTHWLKTICCLLFYQKSLAQLADFFLPLYTCILGLHPCKRNLLNFIHAHWFLRFLAYHWPFSNGGEERTWGVEKTQLSLVRTHSFIHYTFNLAHKCILYIMWIEQVQIIIYVCYWSVKLFRSKGFLLS